MSKKVLVIGLDGGTWKVFDPLMQEGYMPNLKRLVEEGVSGILESTKPPITPAAWTSFQTGTTPDKHGIFDFSNFDRETKQFSFVNSSFIKVETIFEYLSNHGKKVISINLPMTYPPKKIKNGIIIGCLLTPSIKSNFIYPPELKKRFLKKFPTYTISPEGLLFKYNPSQKGFEKFLVKMVEQVKEKRDIALYMMEEYPWDVFIIQFQSLDQLQHGLWPYMDKKHHLFDETKYKLIAEKYFMELDNTIIKIKGHAHNNSIKNDLIMIILSDHGFRGVDKSFSLLKWLLSRRYAYSIEGSKGFLSTHLWPWLTTIDKYYLRRRIPFLRGLRERQRLFNSFRGRGFDLEKSRAITLGGGWGNIFFVSDIKSVEKEIINAIKSLRDPYTDEPIVDEIYRTADLYGGKDSKYLPDLLIKPRPGYVFTAKYEDDIFNDSNNRQDPYRGDHDLDGVVLFTGFDVLKRTERIMANIWDIAPTFLYAMGLPVPSSMDGKVLKDIFNKEFLEREPLRHIDSPTRGSSTKLSNRFQTEEEKAIQKRLKDLGYL